MTPLSQNTSEQLPLAAHCLWASSPETTQISNRTRDLLVTLAGHLGRGSNEKRLWEQTALFQTIIKLLLPLTFLNDL